ncbi:hypothetical protein ACFX5F_03440 [Flavobacterium sp. ZS1P70]|uniref:DUF4412 domain-containing protein n=1 Tax=Flavobacterium zhoui TaxID=3230414 RepID=A0ABW6I396_9FLAO
MKYKLILLLFLISSINSYSQKKYSFDYIIEYNFQKNETSKIEKRYLLTNSEDDSYSVYVYEEDNLNFKMDFKDEKGIRSISIIDKSQFFKAETISLACESIHYQKEKHKYDMGRFDFMNKEDTLIDGVSYKNYVMKYHKNSESKRYNRGISHYVVENSTEFHLPLMMFSSIFDVSVTSKNRPNGIAKEIFSLSHDEKHYEFIYKLSQFVKTKKYLEVPIECDYTNPKISKYK